MSNIMVRLLEKITGRVHQHKHADKVNEVAGHLKKEVAEFSERLKPYTESDDPLTALMTDVYNKRQLYGKYFQDEGRK